MTTLEEVRKAYEDLSEDDKAKFHQSLKDRVDESVAAQEREHGEEDSQTAKDRIDEAEGAEKADEERKEEAEGENHEAEEHAEKAEDKAEEAEEQGKPEGEPEEPGEAEGEPEPEGKPMDIQVLEEAISKAIAPLVERLDKLERSPRPAEAGISDKLTALANRFEN